MCVKLHCYSPSTTALCPVRVGAFCPIISCEVSPPPPTPAAPTPHFEVGAGRAARGLVIISFRLYPPHLTLREGGRRSGPSTIRQYRSPKALIQRGLGR